MKPVLTAVLVLALSACSGSGSVLPATDSGSTGSGGDSGDTDDTSPPDDSASEDTAVEEWVRPEADPSELPTRVMRLALELDLDAMERLDANPYAADDEAGVFVDEDGVRHEVELNYRGAYALRSVISAYDLRNWKVKFDKEDAWHERREWNLNYEPHLTQELAYDLFLFAGVAVPSSEHVILSVNGEEAGTYVLYEDPDNKDWLADWFGDDEGDLYKAAFDIPGEPQCFGDLTWLGEDDAAYDCHYAKKTNHKVAPGDYSVLRSWLDPLNHLDDDEVDAWFDAHVDVERFISYLVVSNFIANWDSYPQRPKNYWVYEDRRSERMVFVPWDLDGTFSPWRDSTYNQMGTTAPVLYNLEAQDYRPVHEAEGSERPLVRRLMASEARRAAYVARYKELNETILSREYLDDRVTSLMGLLLPEVSTTDRGRLESNESSLRQFIAERTKNVTEELATLP